MYQREEQVGKAVSEEGSRSVRLYQREEQVGKAVSEGGAGR